MIHTNISVHCDTCANKRKLEPQSVLDYFWSPDGVIHVCPDCILKAYRELRTLHWRLGDKISLMDLAKTVVTLGPVCEEQIRRFNGE